MYTTGQLQIGLWNNIETDVSRVFFFVISLFIYHSKTGFTEKHNSCDKYRQSLNGNSPFNNRL